MSNIIKDIKISETPLEDITYNSKAANDSLASSMINMWFGESPKMKVSSSMAYEHLKTASYIATVNSFMYMNCLLKKIIAEGHPIEEALGEVQLQLKSGWSAISRSKLGCSSFLQMDLNDIINMDEPSELMEKSSTFGYKSKQQVK